MMRSPMRELIEQLRAKVARDSKLGLSGLMRKGLRYAQEVATAPIYLYGVTERGVGIRTLGRPRIENLGRLTIGDGTLLRSVNVPVELATGPTGTLDIGKDVRLNYGVSIAAMGSVRLGNRVRVGPYVMIVDTEFHGAYDRNRMPEPRPITIEDDVWIGAKATIMPGVKVGRGSIVGVSSVVAADVPPFTVVLGIPARPVRKLDPAQFEGNNDE
jgi:maltose O-acetyltransferase